MAKIDKRWLILLVAYSATFVSCARPGATAVDHIAPEPVFASDNPHSIYAADPNDSWNRIFRALFTRTVKVRLSHAFPEGAPFVRVDELGMRSVPFRISKEKFSRTELGDRAIEPLYPSFFTNEGPAQVFSDPRFSELKGALQEAIDEPKTRSAIERALMQADVWAAYDIVYDTELRPSADFPQRKVTVLNLLRQLIQKLALSIDDIKSLKSNYLLAVHASGSKLPNLFASESGWLEIELSPHRLHDAAAGYRRATRVFVKPRQTPSDPGQFVESLKHQQHRDQVEAVALVIQNLLIDKAGRVVPSPVITDVQFRFFKIGPEKNAVSAELQQFELSRRKLLTEPTSGGLIEYSPSSQAYLNEAGNDYNFATPLHEAEAPVVVPLRTRCAECHGSSLTLIMTYAIHDIPPVPTTRILTDQERAVYVARRKEERDDFKSLRATR